MTWPTSLKRGDPCPYCGGPIAPLPLRDDPVDGPTIDFICLDSSELIEL